MNRIRLSLGLTVAALLSVDAAFAQQATISTPMHRVGDRFHEQIGVGFGVRLHNQPGFFFHGGSPAPTAANGFSLSGPIGGGGYFNVFGDQGSTRTSTSVVPSVTVVNGGQGMIQDVTLRPFVIGAIPVVGGFSAGPPVPFYGMAAPQSTSTSVLEERLARLRHEGGHLPKANSMDSDAPRELQNVPVENSDDSHAARHAEAAISSAGRPAQSIAEIRQRQHQQESAASTEARRLLQRGRELLNEGRTDLAKLYFQQALSQGNEEVREAANAALSKLGKSSPKQP